MLWKNNIRPLFAVAIILTAMNIVFENEVNERQEEIASRVLRFHVRANSDCDEDQSLKMKVKDTVVKYIGELLGDSESAAQSAKIIEDNMTGILNVAQSVILAEGYNYPVSGYIVNEYFPLRVYGDVALPPGCYNAFRIDIGEAQGRNWWCVLYPALCFADISHGVVPQESKEELKAIVGDEDYVLTETTTLEFKYLKFMNKWVE